MRQQSQDLLDVLSGSFTRRLFVNVFHGSDRVAEGLAFESWSMTSDIDGQVCHSIDGTVIYPSIDGESLLPKGTKGTLSPFRARLELVMEISAGDFVRNVSLGIFRQTAVPSGRDFVADVGGVEKVVSTAIAVSLRSVDEDVRRRGFRSPEQPPSLTSCYDEIRRITAMPVEETVTDAAIPAATTWEARQGGRLDAVHTLGRALGGTAVVNSVGAWTIIPDTIGSPVGTIRLGELGTVVDVGAEIDTDDVYNAVVGIFEDAERNPIYAVAVAGPGDLDPDGLYGENTRYYSSDFVKTQAQASSAVQSILALSLGSQQYDVQIQCHVNPLIELGDVVELEGWTRPLVGQVRRISMSDSAYMNVTLRVHREL